jgi:polyferredoxin
MATPAPSKRLRLLRALHAQPHRYPKIRWLTQGLTLATLYTIPLVGLARFDLWDGRHLAMRRHVGPVYGLGAVFIGVLAFYIVTFGMNAVMGRVFCGFGCPIGEVSRRGEDVETGGKTRMDRARLWASSVGFSLALAGAASLWFVSPYVFVQGSARAIAATVGCALALTAALQLHGRYWRWNFCAGFCPIGIYYSAVVSDHGYGIHFDAAKHTCKECDSCDLVCPVGLHPRDLTAPKNAVVGIAIEGFPENNHCLNCGECVRACENQFRKEGRGAVPLRLSFKGAVATIPAERPPKASGDSPPASA